MDLRRSRHDEHGKRRERDPRARHEASSVGAFDFRALGIKPEDKGPKAKLVRFAERHHWNWLGRTLQVQQRFSDLRGNQIAAAVTLQAFLALFPLVLVAIAVIGFIAANGNDVPARVVSNLGLHGSAASSMTSAFQAAERSRRVTSIIGVLGLFWSGLGLVGALQSGCDQVWQVAGRGWKDKLWGLLWLAGAAVVFAASAALDAVVNVLPGVLAPLSILLALVVAIGLWWWTLKVLTDADVGWRTMLPGAVLGAVGFEVLKTIGAIVVPRTAASASQMWGTIGVLFALLAWLLIFGRLFVYANVLNVVLHEGEHGVETAVVRVPRQGADAETVMRSGAEPKSPEQVAG